MSRRDQGTLAQTDSLVQPVVQDGLHTGLGRDRCASHKDALPERLASAVSKLRASLLLAAVFVCAGSGVRAAEPEVAAPSVLYHAFAVDRSGRWSVFSLPTEASAWHVGSPDGPTATRADLDKALAVPRLLVVGAACPGTTRGSTHVPCTVELTSSAPWRSISGDTLTHFGNSGQRASVLASSEAAAPTSPVEQLFTLPKLELVDAFVGFMLPDPAARDLREGWKIRVVHEATAREPLHPGIGQIILSPSPVRARRAASGSAV